MTWKKWFQRKWKRCLFRRGWRYCPICRKFVKILFVQEVIYHPEEPPMFFRWECSHCHAKTPVIPSCITIDAVKSLGYEDFSAYVKKLMERRKDEHSQAAQ